MKKLLLRILAYALDSVLVTAIVLLFASFTLFNPQLTKLREANTNFLEIQTKYRTLVDEELSEVLNDGIITTAERDNIIKEFDEYSKYFKDVKTDKTLDSSVTNKLQEDIEEEYRILYNNEAYKVQKYNTASLIISFIVTILYFGILQYFLKGQTLFKKLFKLRVVDNKTEKNIPLWKSVLRAFIIKELFFDILDIIGVFTVKQSSYLVFNNLLYNARYIFELLIIIVLIIRDDQRSIHDLLFNTKVVMYDKEGNIIPDEIPVSTEVKEEVKQTKKVTTKKKTSKKKEREVVVAEKVTDEETSN